MNPGGSPRGRDGVGAVWTGSKMFAWGGVRDGRYQADGGLYDPVSDSWRSTTLVNAPHARELHDVFWTGKEMIVWGGYAGLSGGSVLNTGGRYDPVAETWTDIPWEQAPVARSGSVTAWTGSKMLVWSGYGTSGLGTGSGYDPATDLWTPMATEQAPAARYGATRVWTGIELMVWGGGDGSSTFSDGGRYDPIDDVWTPMRPPI